MTKLLLLLFSGLKLGKILTTGGTMLLSVFAYMLVFGFWYAVGFVLLIFFHEMGHYLAARQRGLDVGAPVFIPFLGAWVALKDVPMNAETEAHVGLAGPLAGTVAAIVCYYYAQYTHSTLILAISYAGFFINLFNLIPIRPFDGGRICAAVSRKMWWIGAPVLVALLCIRFSPILILMLILALPQFWQSIRGQEQLPPGYYDVPLAKRFEYGAIYFGLLGYLSVMSSQVHETLVASVGTGF